MSTAFTAEVPKRRMSRRQDEIFRGLTELYLRRGFADLTIEETAAELRCSKSTIYALADSREQLVRAVAIAFFRDAAERVEERIARVSDPIRRITVYLEAVSDVLRPASPAFMDDVAAFGPAREVYELNTRIAAGRVRTLIEDGVRSGAFRDVPSGFAAEAVTVMMVAIQQREFAKTSGLTDAEAYSELAALLLNGIRAAVSAPAR
jgi:AcrR family transcriptional regulator